jgi:hypothetical protein
VAPLGTGLSSTYTSSPRQSLDTVDELTEFWAVLPEMSENAVEDHVYVTSNSWYLSSVRTRTIG